MGTMSTIWHLIRKKLPLLWFGQRGSVLLVDVAYFAQLPVKIIGHFYTNLLRNIVEKQVLLNETHY